MVKSAKPPHTTARRVAELVAAITIAVASTAAFIGVDPSAADTSSKAVSAAAPAATVPLPAPVVLSTQQARTWVHTCAAVAADDACAPQLVLTDPPPVYTPPPPPGPPPVDPVLLAEWSKVASCEEGGWVGASGPAFPDSLGITAANWYHFGGGNDTSPGAQITVAMNLITATGAAIPDQNGCQPGGW